MKGLKKSRIWLKTIRNKDGIGIVETLVVGAIGATIVAGTMKTLSVSLQSSQVVKSTITEANLQFAIGQVLNDEDDCKANFKPKSGSIDSNALGLYGTDRELGRGQLGRLVKNVGETDEMALLERGKVFKENSSLEIVKMRVTGDEGKTGDSYNPKKVARERNVIVYYKRRNSGSFNTLHDQKCSDDPDDPDRTLAGCYFYQCSFSYRLEDKTNPAVTTCAVRNCTSNSGGIGGGGGNVKCYTANESYTDGKTIIGCSVNDREATGDHTTAIGFNAGVKVTGEDNTFIGRNAGFVTLSGHRNTFLGARSGAQNTSGYYNTFLGQEAGNKNTTGHSNIFIGWRAGYKNTNANLNTFIGAQAGESNITGKYNTFIGEHSGQQNTASYNTFIGQNAGRNNLNGDNNTFLGQQAGNDNTSGSSNIFIGKDSGLNNTTGFSNTFIGKDSGLSNIGGYHNTFIGFSSGKGTTGNKNTFLGWQAGISNTEGKVNTFIGANSGHSNIQGKENTFIGVASGYNNSTGNNNVFIGRWAGRMVTSGSNNIAIGKDVRLDSTTESNQINIGNKFKAKGDYIELCPGGNCQKIKQDSFTCPAGQMLRGVKSDGSRDCVPASCPEGQYLKGFNDDGTIECGSGCPTSWYEGHTWQNGLQARGFCCPRDSPLYNLHTRKCTPCPDGTPNYNKTLNTCNLCAPPLQLAVSGASRICCQSGKINSKGKCCSPGKVWAAGRCRPACTVTGQIHNSSGNCVCPTGQIVAAGQCRTRCLHGKTYNSLGTCVCPTGQVFATGRCRPDCLTGQIRNSYGNCVCSGGKVLAAGRCRTACTGDRTYNSSGNCVCPGSQVWAANQCRWPCAGNSNYNSEGRCVCPTGQAWASGPRECRTKCPQGQYFNREGNCVCPSRTVFTANQCRAECSGDRVYDSSNNCTCPNSKPVWSNNLCCPSGKVNPFIITSENFLGLPQKHCCPTARPYYHTNTCNRCPQHQPYLRDKTCNACPTAALPIKGPDKRTCVSCPGNYVNYRPYSLGTDDLRWKNECRCPGAGKTLRAHNQGYICTDICPNPIPRGRRGQLSGWVWYKNSCWEARMGRDGRLHRTGYHWCSPSAPIPQRVNFTKCCSVDAPVDADGYCLP